MSVIFRTKAYSPTFTLAERQTDRFEGSDDFEYLHQKQILMNVVDKVAIVQSDPTESTGRMFNLNSIIDASEIIDYNKDFRIFGESSGMNLVEVVGYAFEDHTISRILKSAMSLGEEVSYLTESAERHHNLSFILLKESVLYERGARSNYNVIQGTGARESVSVTLVRHILSPYTLQRTWVNAVYVDNNLTIGESVSFVWSGRDSYVYDVGNDAWGEYTNMKIINANVLNSGIALNNVNLLLKNNGKIRKYPSNLITEEQAMVTTKVINVEKGVIQSLGLIGEDDGGSITVEVGKLDEFDSQTKRIELNTPIKLRAKANHIPKGDGYGRTFFAQVRNMLSIRNIIFKYKERIKRTD